MAGSSATQFDSVRFGRTVLGVAIGELVDQPVDVLVVAGNCRAMFAAGAAGTLWTAAGEDVERELRGHAPLEIGSAVATGPGRLADRGVRNIVHAIVSPGLGEPARSLVIPNALEEAFERVDEVGGKSLATTIIGISSGADIDARMDGAQVVVDALVAHLRTRKHRIERGILVSRFEDDRAQLEAILVRARERLWTS